MSDLVTYVKFNANAVVGNIASLTYDVDFTAEPNHSENDKAPCYRIIGRTPRNRAVEIGGIWENAKTDGSGTYYSLRINTGAGTINANLGRYPGQDDESLFAIIPREPYASK